MVRPEPYQPLDEADIGIDRRLVARRGFVLENLLRQWGPDGLGGVMVAASLVLAMPASASFLARWASFDLACSSARKSEIARAAVALDGNFAESKPAPGRSRSESKAPHGSAAIAVIELREGPNPNLCRASAAASFPRVSKEIPPANADPTNQ